MKKGVLWGIGLALASVMLWGCSRDYIETAVTEAEVHGQKVRRRS